MKTLLAIILAVACQHAGADTIYKCGKVYSDTPCGADQATIKTYSAAPGGTVSIGMSEEAMRAAMHPGRPITSVNVTETASGVDKQFVIGRHVGSQSYIYTSNGVVTAIQW